jgi:glycosyltransferase involved in cell wall biosynthesis
MTTITLLIPCFNEAASIRPLFRELRDQSSWCRGRMLSFSRNFGKEAALIAGLDHCSSEACIILDADLQDPPELIPQMLESWQAGSKIVCAKRQDRRSDGFLKRTTALFFYRFFKRLSKLEVIVDASDFRLLDQSVVTAICQCRESVRFSKGFFAWAGFSTSYLVYDRPARLQGETKWGSWKLWNYALDGIFNFSSAPLRVWTYVGLSVMLTAFGLGLRIVIQSLTNNMSIPGYASIFVAVTFLGGIQLLGIGIIGEYLGRIYIEAKRRPLYVIRELIET